MFRQGSYANGFAPRDGQPAYPSLWNGCVGAWAQCLGPTGLVLRDWSGRQNHGTFTNMTGSDWQLISGTFSTAQTGTKTIVVSASDVAALNLINFGTWTIAATVRTPSTFSGFPVIYSYGRWRASLGVQAASGKVSHWRNNTTEYVGASVLAANTTYHLAVTGNASAVEFFVNGKSDGTSTGLSAITSGAGSSIGNVALNDGPWGGNVFEVRIYNRILNGAEIALLASRRGIAYDMIQPIWYSPEQAAGFNAAWALRQRVLIGSGGGLG